MAPSATNSPSSSSSSTTTTTTTPSSSSNPNPNPNSAASAATNPMQGWWESISRARSSILSLSSLLPLPSLSSLADSDRPASALLSSSAAYSALSSALSLPSSGSGHDPLCQWLYETFQSSDPDLRLVVLSFLPLLSGLYLSCIISSPSSASLAGFESVLLAVYASEARSRSGKPLTISLPDLSQPSLYHSPRPSPTPRRPNPTIGILSPPLEPQIAVKSTKRACIVGVALDCYYKKISLMPVRSKIDFCEFVVAWAGQDCSCRYELDEHESFDEEDGEAGNCRTGGEKGCRVPLPWELMQPVLKILGHCLLGPGNGQEVRDAASAAVRSVYARASHDLEARVILASRSLIQLDKSARKAARDPVVVGGVASNPSTPSKPKKPEVLLVSK